MRPPTTTNRPNSSKRSFYPAVGIDFPLDEVPSIEAKTRGFLARFISLSVGLSLLATGMPGLWTGNYRALGIVWDVAGPIVGARSLLFRSA